MVFYNEYWHCFDCLIEFTCKLGKCFRAVFYNLFPVVGSFQPCFLPVRFLHLLVGLLISGQDPQFLPEAPGHILGAHQRQYNLQLITTILKHLCCFFISSLDHLFILIFTFSAYLLNFFSFYIIDGCVFYAKTSSIMENLCKVTIYQAGSRYEHV